MDYEWLADLHKSQSFTTCEVSSSAKSSDFGSDGYTASLSQWHELLQLTAPDDTCGLVFARGQFPNTPAAILARVQRRDDSGSKGAFGTGVQRAQIDSDLELGERRYQGWVNLRWPYTQYDLKRRGDQWDEHTGTCEQLSFVKDGTVFQLMRLKWGHGSSLSDYSDSMNSQGKWSVQLSTGGTVQFGCPCSNGGPPSMDTFQFGSKHADGKVLLCTSERYQKRLEVELFVNGVQQDIGASVYGLDDEVHGTEVDTSTVNRFELSIGEPSYIVTTYTLRSSSVEYEVFDEGPFSDLQDYLGIASTSVNMTDRLWTALCSTNYEASEAVEGCVIGRCVEQILGVSSIPSTIPSNSDRSPSFETALLCNIITPQFVNVQSAFFQIRLLTKAYNFIQSRHFEPDLLQRFRSLDDVRNAYLQRLSRSIRSFLVWLINTDMKPGKLLLASRSFVEPMSVETHPSERLQQCEQNRVQMVTDQSYNQACYATIAVWYVMKHCSEAITGDFVVDVLQPRLNRAYDLVQKRASRDKEPTPKNDVLQWLHLCCLFLICNNNVGFNEEGEDVDGFMASDLDRQELLKTQQKFEKYVSRLKTSQIESYSLEHEELDHIILLSEELGLKDIPTQFTFSLGSSRAGQTRKRITERKRTTRFNSGPKAWKGFRVTSNGPWELMCVNHQSFMRVADDSNIRAARDRLFEFMMSDYSFMTSWDRADSNMIGRWWDLEPASVICATLLDLKVEGKLQAAPSEKLVEEINQSIHDLHESSEAMEAIYTVSDPSPVGQSIRDILSQMKQIQEDSSRDHLSQIRQLLAQEELGGSLSIKAFDWIKCKPHVIFHPELWTQSLDDTPDVFQAKQTKNVPLRKDIKRYFFVRKRQDIIETPEYSIASISQKIASKDLQFLSVFDLYLSERFTFFWKNMSIENTTSKHQISTDRNRFRNSQNGPRIQSTQQLKQDSVSYSDSKLDLYRKELFGRLNDSLVDLGAKYRILFAEKCSPSVVGAFIYMWHPDALDTIDSYFGAASRFSENREASMWTTSITISHWSIRPSSVSKKHHDLFTEKRNNGDFPPVSIASLEFASKKRETSEEFPPTAIVEERSSSLVITGDTSGYHWICSVWSSLTDSEEFSHAIQSLPRLLQSFIHQQACGRCLVFLVLLGHLCEKLASEYEFILSRLDVIVGLGEKVLLEGLEWGTNEAVDKLKKMLWGLEALRVFDDRLSGSLSQIQKAQEAMERIVKQEAGSQHIDLLQEYNNVIEEFEKRYGMLSDVQVRTQLKIRQVTGLRDGISTVTNVEDSQTALRDSKTTIRQGNNIRILTYITIAYLPLGFVTALFSVSHAPFMDNAGNVLFAILVALFVSGTYALALSLESIIDQWSRLRKERWGLRGPTPPPLEHDHIEWNLSFNALGSCWGLRRRKQSGEMVDKTFQAA